eukprot:6483773-Amphidinium_carterae.1
MRRCSSNQCGRASPVVVSMCPFPSCFGWGCDGIAMQDVCTIPAVLENVLLFATKHTKRVRCDQGAL